MKTWAKESAVIVARGARRAAQISFGKQLNFRSSEIAHLWLWDQQTKYCSTYSQLEIEK